MSIRSNGGFNLSLKGNSFQSSGNISSRPSTARNNSQSKQAITSSRAGDSYNQMVAELLHI